MLLLEDIENKRETLAQAREYAIPGSQVLFGESVKTLHAATITE